MSASESGYTTIGISPEYRDLLNSIADYHGLKVVEFLPMLLASYAYISPEGREGILDIGSKIVAYHKAGMEIIFEDSLIVSDECEEKIINV